MARKRWPCFFLNARRRRDGARDLYSCQRTNMIVEFRSLPKRARAAYLVHYMEIASAARSAPDAKPHPPGTAEFRYWTAAEALRRGADFWGALLPGISWEVGSILPVDLDFGADLNAFYDRERLKFFHGPAAGRTVFSAARPTLVHHALGHAVR